MTESTPSANNTRGLLKSMAVIASAQFLSIIIRILQAKLVAVLLGPSGVGLLGMLNNLYQMAWMSAGLGLGSSGVREISGARGDPEILSRVRRVLLGAMLVQGVVAMSAIWLAREWLSVWLLGNTVHADDVGLVGVAAMLFLFSNAHIAVLQGMRRIEDIGRVTVGSVLIGTLAGLSVVALLGHAGLIWLILLPPAVSLLLARRYTRRLPLSDDAARLTHRYIWRAWLSMVRLGVVFVVSAITVVVALLIIRARITNDLGIDATGYFTAAWSITFIFLSLVKSMEADYFPRLTEAISDREAATLLMNDQTQLALALGGPILLMLIGSAPWMLHLLYSAEFSQAATILQWQSVGSVFKLASWALAFAFVASGRASAYLMTELLFSGAFLSMVWFGLEPIGLNVTGSAFLVACVLQFFMVVLLVRRIYSFHWHTFSLRLFGCHVLLAAGLLVLTFEFPLAGAIVAPVLGLGTGFIGGRILLGKIGPHGRLALKAARIYEILKFPVKYGS